MELKKEITKKKRPLGRKILRVLAWVVGSLIALILLILLLIQLPSVQNYGRKKIVTYLEHKLHTKVAIGKLSIGFPTTISLQKVFFEDQSKDTLLYGNEIAVNLKMFQLLRKNIVIKEIYLDGLVAKVKRLPPDSVFNFQFIVDAFASENKKNPEATDTAPLKMKIDQIVVNKSHIIYNDRFTGNDMNVTIGNLDAKIKTFDPSHLLFDVPSIKLDGLAGYFYQREPLPSMPSGPPDEAADPNKFLQFLNKKIQLSNINLQFKNEPSQLAAQLKFADFLVHPETIDLKHLQFRFKDATLKNADIVAKIHSDKTVVKPKDTTNPASETKLKLIAGDLKIIDSHIQFDDESKSPTSQGMDFSHLKFSDLSMHSSYLEYTADTTLVVLKKAQVKEKSGFDLQEMHVTFYMIPSGIFLGNLLIKTPESEIKDKIYLTYESLDAIKKDMGELGLFINIDNSHLGLKDLYTFAPQLRAKAHLSGKDAIYLNTNITGKVSEMSINGFELNGLSQTNINLKGKIKGLPDANRLFADLDIRKFQSSANDLHSIMPPNSLPKNITIPERFSANGKILGGLADVTTDFNINTTLGNAKLKGRLINITDSIRARYDMVLQAQNLQLGKLIKNDKVGNINGNVIVKGVGYTPSRADATFTGQFANLGFNHYNYRNISAQGSIKSKIFKIDAFVHDPNLYASVTANGNFVGTYPTVSLVAQIDSIKTLPLHFTDSAMIYHGKIAGDFSNTNPDNLIGNLMITNSIFVNNGRRIKLDTIKLVAMDSGNIKDLRIESGFLFARIKGNYKLTQMANVFKQAINPYFSIGTPTPPQNVDPYSFTVEAAVNDNEVLHGLLPDLVQMKKISLTGNFSSDTGWNLLLKGPYIEYGTNKIYGLQFVAGTKDSSKLKYNASFDQLVSGTSLQIYSTTLSGSMVNNNANFKLDIKDQQSKDKYILKGNLLVSNLKNLALSLDPSNLVLNYEKWNIKDDNQIRYSDSGIVAHNFLLSNSSQQLQIQSSSQTPNSPLKVSFLNFQIKTLTAIANQDSLLVNGILDGQIEVSDLQKYPIFLADISVKDLSIYADTIGLLTAKIDNKVAQKYHASVSLSGRGNQLSINGDYWMDPKNSRFDFLLDIPQFQMKSLEGFTKGQLRESQGFLFGKVRVDGTTNNPNIDGKINFDNTSFNVAALNGVFRIDKEAIAIINNEGIRFEKFTIRDTINNALTIDGIARTTNFRDYTFDMGLRAKNFEAINSTKKDNDLFYGRLVFSTNLKIKGTPSLPIIDGDFTVEDKTDFTVVLPQGNQGIESREGIVRFVDRSATPEDSLFMQSVDTLNVVQLKGYDVAVNINVDKNAVFNLIVDEGNGDFLRLKGVAQLTGGIDASGKITLVGSYEIEEGSYDLSFNFLKRKFIIQKGSRIVWTGEPTSAQIDVTAIYVANTAPLDLVSGQMAGDPVVYRQKLPFDVYLMMKGELLKPVISFDIQLPSDKNYGVSTDVVNTVQSRLIQLRQEPDNLNKQVFALLLLNRFVGEDPFNNSASSSLDAGTFAKQSVSKLLTEQLNNLAANLIDGVDINFDLATTEDYSTGKKMDKTNFNVAVSKRLLNDRLTVTVGSNFELEGPQAGSGQQNNFADNININYKLSKDGRYALRFYRKNDYTGTIEGYVVETGIGFIITLDYDRFRDLFSSKEKRRKKREIKRKNKEIEKMDEQKKEDVQTELSPVNKVSNEK